jgi:hypothetical protein
LGNTGDEQEGAEGKRGLRVERRWRRGLILGNDFDYVEEDVAVIGVAPVSIFVAVGDTAKSFALNQDVMTDGGEGWPRGQFFWPLFGRRLLLGAHSLGKVGGVKGSCKEFE